jgi:hypothetical protein
VEGDFNTPGLGTNVVCEDLQIVGCQNGISFYWAEGNCTVRRCSVHHGGGGINLAGAPAGYQNMVTDCQVVQCTNSGIVAGLVTNCVILVNGLSSPTAIYTTQAVGCKIDGGSVTIAHRSDMP